MLERIMICVDGEDREVISYAVDVHNIVNLTLFDVTILTNNGNVVIPVSGVVASVITVKRSDLGKLSPLAKEIGMFAIEYEFRNMPRQEPLTKFIVYEGVFNACADRADFMTPGTIIRNADSKFTGYWGLQVRNESVAQS